MEKLLDKKEAAAKKVWTVSKRDNGEDRYIIGAFTTEQKAYEVADKLNKRSNRSGIYWEVDDYTLDRTLRQIEDEE